ncbi:MAG: EFR1 family ferrodoxin, partial [Methanoregula sp.]|nr:EFR1 family ferrodoxin [Methanoregula sp.]
ITGPVLRCERRALPSSLIPRILFPLIYPYFRSHAHTDDKKFSVTDKCTSCGTCVALCPAKNIELVDKKPVFLHHCELCCGCIHNCPVQAIQAGARTEKWQRYRHPEITVAELKGKPEENA